MDTREEEAVPTLGAETQGSTEPVERRARPMWRRRGVLLTCGGILVAASLAIGVPTVALAVTAASERESAVSASTSDSDSATTERNQTDSVPNDPRSYGGGTSESGETSSSSAAIAAATAADEAESTGVVIIETVIGYESSAAAGTGMVLTEDGLVLTNNHVVDGATEITVTIATTGETYTATLVGTDDEDDVALLQLGGASGLDTVTLDDDTEAVGDAVTAVGNADGGGVLMAADGEITALESGVTTSASLGSESETLDGMIEIVADVVSGDSGGALLDSEGEVIGMTTAASTGTVTTVAYAIPVEDALAIVQQILDGDESDGVTIGYPAFLGVQMSQDTAVTTTFGARGRPGRGSTTQESTATTAGATVAGVIEDTPAADLGLVAGDSVTAIDGVAIADASALSETLAGYDPGDTVAISWTDSDGTTHSASVTLIAGPVG